MSRSSGGVSETEGRSVGLPETCTTFLRLLPTHIHERGGYSVQVEELFKTHKVVDVQLTSNGKVMFKWEKK